MTCDCRYFVECSNNSIFFCVFIFEKRFITSLGSIPIFLCTLSNAARPVNLSFPVVFLLYFLAAKKFLRVVTSIVARTFNTINYSEKNVGYSLNMLRV